MSFLKNITNLIGSIRNDSNPLKSAYNKVFCRRPLNVQERRQWVSSKGLIHRAMWMVPEEALAKGWTCNSSEEQDLACDIDKFYGLEQAVGSAWGAARIDGGAWLFIVGDGLPENPFIDGVTEVFAIHDLTLPEVTQIIPESDIRSREFGRPKYVSISINRNGVNFQASKVHLSRLVYIPGAPLPKDANREKEGYDLSYLELYRDAYEDLESGWRSASRLMERLSFPWLQIKDGVNAKAAEGNENESSNTFLESISLFKQGMEKDALFVSVNDDAISWVGPNTQGSRDLITISEERFSVPEGIPLIKFFGQAPGGLSTDDVAGMRNYHDILERYQTKLITPVLLSIYQKLFGVDLSRDIVWPSLERLNEIEKAQLSLTYAQRGQILVMNGVVSVEEERARFEYGNEVSNFVLDQFNYEAMTENALPGDPLGNGEI